MSVSVEGIEPPSTEPAWDAAGKPADVEGARLVFDAITHVYDDVVALDDVSLEVEAGEVFCLLGHSGCGKTTLLRIGAGVERQVSGRVAIDGQTMAGPDRFVPPEARGIGLMFQDYALFPHLTILRNVMFGLSALSAARAREEAMQSLERLGMAGYADAYPHALSGGEQQRVALARAIAPKPSVLLMDEPFSGLDQRLRDSVRTETLAVLRETGATSVLVTHDPEEAMRLGDRIGLMRAGRIAQIGRPEELYLRPSNLFAARFFSPLNEFAGSVANGAVLTPLGRFEAGGLAEGASARVAIRPHAFTISTESPDCVGTVVSARLLGEVTAVEFEIEGGGRCRARLSGVAGLAAGEAVGFNVDRRYVLVFSDEPE